VVLKVNDKSFTSSDLEKELAQQARRLPPEVQRLLTTKEGQKQYLDRMVQRELLMQAAEKEKIDQQPEVADQLKALRQELMLQVLLRKEVEEKVKVDDKEVQDYFQANPDEFSGDKIHAKHILLQNEDEAKLAQDRLKKESFEDVAKAMSRDSYTAQKGGDLDYLGREQMIPEFAKAVFALKPGEVSQPVKTPFGYHLIKLVDRKKGQPFAFEQVKDQLKQRLLSQRQTERFQAWLKELEGGAKITREEAYLPVSTPFAGPPAGPAGPVGPPAAAPAPDATKPGSKS
jgi:peptidyl-prolyl cis-trans isomerase C